MANFVVQNNGADSTVTNITTGVIVFSGPYERALSQAAELNRQSSGAYNPETTVTPTSTPAGQVTAAEQNNIATASAPVYTAASVNSTTPVLVGDTAPVSKLTTGADSTYTATPIADLGTITITASPDQKQQPIGNPLHEYDSYTYGLSLHLLNIGDFNNLVDNPEMQYNPVTYTPSGAVGTVLVASAGRYQNFGRNPAFVEDFYFDNFKMSSYINTTSRNKNSNLIECSFTIIEPSGFTFINRLISAADMINGSVGNYIKMPYLLQIDFFGHKDGNISPAPIPGMSKMIPISLVEMKSRVTSKGTEYAIRAVPFNHQAFNQTNAVSPADFLINAKTVSDVFGSGTTDIAIANKIKEQQDRQRQESDLSKRLAEATSDTVRESLSAQLNSLRSVTQTGSSIQVTGYTDGVNSWWEDLRKANKVVSVNRVNVVFDPIIGSSPIFPSGGPVTVQQVAGDSGQTNQKTTVQAQGGISKGKIDFNAGVMAVPAGTSVETLIDWAVRNSNYITSQIDQKNPGQPLNWYRIVPKIKITNYEQSTNLYTIDITYYVRTWKTNSKNPAGPLGRVPGWVKEYQYLYTGQNKDILDMQIDFNMMYYVQATANGNKNKYNDTAKAVADPNLAKANDGNPNSVPEAQAAPVVVQYGKLQPVPVVYSSNNVKSQGRAGVRQDLAVAAGDVKESLQNDARGDMINVKLKILGDPHFIKQDDIFYNQNAFGAVGQLTPNGSLYTDSGELYVYLLFRFPVDYNEETGLAIPANSQFNRSEWSGVYKIIKVDNEFNKGKFEQVLDLVRLPIPDELLGQNNNVQQRLDTLNLLALGQANPFQAVRFTGPNILKAALNQVSAANSATAALQAGSNQLQTILAQAGKQVVNSVVSAVSKKAQEFAQPYLDTAKRGINDILGTTNPKYVEGSDQFVGPVRGSGGGMDYKGSADQYDAETARLLNRNAEVAADADWNSLITDMQTESALNFNDEINLSGFEDIPDLGITVDPAEYAASLGDFAG